MTYNELVDAAKLRVRKLSNDALDEDVKTHVDFVLADLKRIGAVLAYVKAYYGMDAYHDKWLAAYDMHLTRIKGGDYK